jgi:hypothetical protein
MEEELLVERGLIDRVLHRLSSALIPDREEFDQEEELEEEERTRTNKGVLAQQKCHMQQRTMKHLNTRC